MRLEGIVVPIVTPISSTGIDEEAAAELTEGLIRGGIHGLFVGGTTGEGPLLSVDERRALLRVVRRQAAGRVPVLASIAAISIDQGRTLSAMAAEDGADIAVIMTPHFYHYEQSELRTYFETLLRESALPVALYELPARTGNRLSIATVRVLTAHPRLVAFKDSSGDMGYFLRLLKAVRPDVPVLMGDDALILPAMAAGAAGGVCGLGQCVSRSHGQSVPCHARRRSDARATIAAAGDRRAGRDPGRDLDSGGAQGGVDRKGNSRWHPQAAARAAVPRCGRSVLRRPARGRPAGMTQGARDGTEPATWHSRMGPTYSIAAWMHTSLTSTP